MEADKLFVGRSLVLPQVNCETCLSYSDPPDTLQGGAALHRLDVRVAKADPQLVARIMAENGLEK